jgi:hypothetical protein
VAAKKARVKSVTPAARAKAVKRIKAVKRNQKKTTIRFKAVCRTPATPTG